MSPLSSTLTTTLSESDFDCFDMTSTFVLTHLLTFKLTL